MNTGRSHRSISTITGPADRRRSRRDILKLAVAGGAALAATGASRTSPLVNRTAAQEAGSPQPRPQTVLANDVELGYVAAGRGDPVIFVHGSLNDLRSWGLQLGPFAERHRTIAYSRRYHWPNHRAATAGEAYAARLHADDLAGLIEALAVGPAHVVGSSYGALVGLLLAARKPELVRSLVLGEPPLLTWLGQVPDGPAILGAFAASTWEPARQALADGDVEMGVRLFLDGAVGPGTYDQLPSSAQTMMLENAPAMGLETSTPLETYVSAFSRADAAKIERPALLLTGEFSPAVFKTIDDELARHLAGAERVMISRSSHVQHVANPLAYNAAVLDFLATH